LELTLKIEESRVMDVGQRNSRATAMFCVSKSAAQVFEDIFVRIDDRGREGGRLSAISAVVYREAKIRATNFTFIFWDLFFPLLYMLVFWCWHQLPPLALPPGSAM